VLYVWDAEYPWDVRTEKVCRALVDGGHQVVITARNLHGKARTEQLPEGLVERLAPGPRWTSFPAFFHPRWIGHLRAMVRKHAIDLVMVRDLPLAPTALMTAGGRPVILDMAENYAEMMRDIFTDGRAGALDHLVRRPAVVSATEKYVVRRVDHILTVVEESSERVEKLGVPAERLSVVSNTPPSSRVGPLRPTHDGPMRLIYLGLMERHRGILTTLDAVAALKREGVPFHLDMVGDGRDYEEMRQHAGKLGLGAADVTIHGRLSHKDAIAVVGRADVGLVPHVARESWNTTIANKLFDYMAAGLAVITSDAIPSARVVRATGAGLVFKSSDSADLVDQMRLCMDPGVRAQFGAAGQHAVRTRYNWEADTRTLLDVVARTAARSR
jgi:glycosyltransferase involved in cell wall biosynthesis